MRTTVVHPEARPPISFREHAAVERSTLRWRAWSVPLHLPFRRSPPSVARLSFGPSLSPSHRHSAPLARAPRSLPSNPLQHALACVNHAYRFSFVGVSEGRAVVAHVCPLLSPFPPLALFAPPLPQPPSDGEPGGRVAPRANPLSENTYAHGTWFFPHNSLYSRFPSAPPPPPCSLASLLLPSSSPPRTPRYVARSPRRLFPLPPVACISDASSLLQPPLATLFCASVKCPR